MTLHTLLNKPLKSRRRSNTEKKKVQIEIRMITDFESTYTEKLTTTKERKKENQGLIIETS